MKSQYLIPLISAFIASTSLLQGFQVVEATRFSSPIGTPKLEGAVSDLAGNFYFCNMAAEGVNMDNQGTIGIIRPGASDAELFMTLPEGMRGNGLRIGPDGNLYMADQQGGRLVRIDPRTQEISIVHDFGTAHLNWAQNPNDVAISHCGQFLYVSCMGRGVHKVAIDGSSATRVLGGTANGVEISPDGKRLILARGIFDINDDGTITDSGIKLEMPAENYAYADGIRVDVEGNIYVARAGANQQVEGERRRIQHPGAVHVFSPDGKMIKNIVAPYARVHNIGFGGPDGKTLYILCPGRDGFVAVYQNDIAGLNHSRLRAWAQQE